MLHCNFLSSCKSYCRKRKCHLHSGSSHFYKDVCVSVCACTLLNYQKAMYTNADTEALTVTATYRVEVRWDQGEREMLSQRQKYVGENTLHTFFTKLCEGVVSTKPKKVWGVWTPESGVFAFEELYCWQRRHRTTTVNKMQIITNARVCRVLFRLNSFVTDECVFNQA